VLLRRQQKIKDLAAVAKTVRVYTHREIEIHLGWATIGLLIVLCVWFIRIAAC